MPSRPETPPRLSPNELAIMNAVWDHEPVTGRDLLTALRNGMAITTLLTYLTRLQGKGCIRRADSPRGYLYSSAVPRDRVAAQHAERAVAQFGGSISALLAHYLKSRKVSGDEKRKLRDLVK